MTRPIGKFKASRELIIGDYPNSLKVMAQFVVLDVRWNWDGVSEYTALSPLFDEIDEALEAPSYEIILTKGANGEISTTAKRL
jgi:hypothetical protein